ncbi:hypothetical protein K474DRAFT_1661313 [Panus rudis PR-1116 ss-1]|nr:hypothetical protein K474DRAFT_1661313 [Panus rudis PR-1116 ss-1]
MNFSNIIFLLACVLPFALTAPISPTSQLQAREDKVDCKQMTRGDGGKFVIPKAGEGQNTNLTPFLNQCFKFTNEKDTTISGLGPGAGTSIDLPSVDCNAVAKGPADDGTYTVDASGLGPKLIVPLVFRQNCLAS